MARRTDLLGFSFVTATRIHFNVLDDFLPLVGRQVITPLLGDLIPPTSWGSSLFNLLTPGCWELLRAQTFAKTGGHCEICGSTGQLECHESWEYHEPIPDHLEKGGVGVQRLVRLMALCSECHDTQHLGLANVKRIFPKVIDRVQSYNRWTASEGRRYWDFLEARSRRRSRCLWALDLSRMAETPLMVKGNWRMGSDGWLSAKTKTGESTTLIFGAGWRRGDVSYPAMSTDAGYYQ